MIAGRRQEEEYSTQDAECGTQEAAVRNQLSASGIQDWTSYPVFCILPPVS
jgi:hypothetical protein